MRSTEDRWKLGDDALAAEPIGRKGPRGGVINRLDQLAEEWGVSTKTLRTCRGVAQAWPRGKRNKQLSWSVHSVLRGQPDRFVLIKDPELTMRTAQELVTSRKIRAQ